MKVIKYQKIPDEIYANNNLKDFLKQNKSPSIVLRVPNNNDRVTSNTANNKDANILYNTIEKELLKNGYSVRDRGLFNEIINKSTSTDYSKIKELTDTELILEVLNIDGTVKYSTNKVTNIYKKKTKEVVGEKVYKRPGASVEFRLILVKNNEIAGTYKYNYQPCPEGCAIGSFKPAKKRGRDSKSTLGAIETVSQNELEVFISNSTKDLIRSFKN